jgi:hypothetical protein
MPFPHSEQEGDGQAIAITPQMDFGAETALRTP